MKMVCVRKTVSRIRIIDRLSKFRACVFQRCGLVCFSVSVSLVKFSLVNRLSSKNIFEFSCACSRL